jgi:diguanylate cyclase (GGDEF)-like protein
VGILLAFGLHTPSWGDWPILVLALAAQFTVDAGTAIARMASLGVSIRVLTPQLGWTFAVDTQMAVIGLALALSADPGWPRILLAGVPVVLVGVLGHDRRRQVEANLSLGAAYTTASEAATHDAMTGLTNRRGWDTAIGEATALLESGPGARVCVIAADLDGLKQANDRFGHESGDALIVSFGRLLTELAPPGAVAARLGGDEFALLVVSDEEPVGDTLVARLRADIVAHEPIAGLTLSASVGWAACPPHADMVAVVRAADDALVLDKQARRAYRRTDPGRSGDPPR